jgi:hypothetical protein
MQQTRNAYLSSFFHGARENSFTTILQIKTFTAIGPLQQQFHFLRSRDHPAFTEISFMSLR